MEPVEPQEQSVAIAQGAGAGCGCAAGQVDAAAGAAAEPAFVYVLGRIEARFPSLGIEKEYAQAVGRGDTVGLTDRQAVHNILIQPQNRYLARQLCWVVTVEGIETYLVQPRDPEELAMLVDAVRPAPRPTDVDVIIGVRGPLAPPSLCNGLQVPLVIADQIYSFDVDALLKGIPRPEGIAADAFQASAEELFYRLLQMADNAGASDEHRALNYLAVRYPAIYARTADEFAHDAALTEVEVRPSRLSAVRRIVDVILTYSNRNTDVSDKFFVRVDVTEQFPFLVTKLSPFYERH